MHADDVDLTIQTQSLEDIDASVRAMKEAMEQAANAAADRAIRKREKKSQSQPALSLDDRDVLYHTALHTPDIPEPAAKETIAEQTITTGLMEDDALEELIRQASADLPEVNNREDFGDLVLIKHDAPAEAWYTQASEQALPGVLRGVKGPVDLKMLVQAMMIEVGDVKRTNAIIIETLARIEEKVERTNRHLRDRRSFKS